MEKTIEELRELLIQPRRDFQKDVKEARQIVGGGDVGSILDDIHQAIEARGPTSKERSLVDAILNVSEDRPSRMPAKKKTFSCVRCGIRANGIATVLAGFACCGSCWKYLDGISDSLGIGQLEVDISDGSSDFAVVEDIDLTDEIGSIELMGEGGGGD